MTYTATSPASTAGPGNAPPVCQNCQTSTTPLWRRDESGSVLCNACGLFLKLHGRNRPISLKTDVIKSRNRVKSSGQAQKRKSQADTMAISALRSDAGTPPTHHRASNNGQASDRSNSPISRVDTPSLHHDPNIAPQHLFDGAVCLHADNYHPSPSLPALHLSHPSPGSTPSLNGRHLEPPPTYEELHRENDKLKTRVSELEVINMLTKQDLDTTRNSEEELKRRVNELEIRLHEREAEVPTKKLRLSDVVQED